MLRRSLGCVLAVGALSLIPCGVAHAQGDSESGELGSAAFKRGLERFRNGEYTEAINIWKRLLGSLGQTRGFKVLYNLGRAYESIGDVTKAAEHYQEFERQVQSKDSAEQAKLSGPRKDAKSRLDKIRQKYGRLNVPAASSGIVLVRVGLNEPQPAGFIMYLAPGKHEVEVHSRTPKAEVRQVTLKAGQELKLSLGNESEPSSAGPTPPADPDPVDTPPEEPDEPVADDPNAREFPWLWVGLGAGLTAVSTALPIALFLNAGSKRDAALELQPSDPGYPSRVDDFESAQTTYAISWALPAVFAVATGAVVVIHLASGPSNQETVSLGVRPGGLQLSGTF